MPPILSVNREYAAENINRVVNHSDVRPWLGGAGTLDLTPLVADLGNVLLMTDTGGVLFQQLEPGLYEAHTQFLPAANAIPAVKDALRFMFTRTDAVEIVTKVPEHNKAALGLVRAIHGQLQFKRDNAWQDAKGRCSVGYYALPIMYWAGKTAELEASGHWFHEKLEAAKSATAGAAPLHDDDAAHDRYVGATVEMIGAGQVAKGLAFYSRWAKFAGYGPVSLIATNPTVIDIGDAILAVNGDDFTVLLCR